MTDISGAMAWVYDERGRVTGETRTVSGISGSFKTEWHYNSADLMDWMKYPEGNSGSAGEQVSYNYLNGGRLAERTGTDWLYYHTDALDSMRSLTDGLGEVVGTTACASYSGLLYRFCQLFRP